jgi:aspartate aminotransferase-like enzyme
VNLIYAFHRSLSTIVSGQLSVAERIKAHAEASQRVKSAATELGLKQVALDDKCAANGMTAVLLFLLHSMLCSSFTQLYFPNGLSAPDM